MANSDANRALIMSWIRENADKYIFQAEDTGDNPHYQGYFHTKKKSRAKTMAIAANDCLLGVEIQPCSCAGLDALKKYCMKDATRVDGPWSDKPIYLGKDLWPEERMPPWQRTMLDIIKKEPDDRTMYWIYDPVGNNGKTKFIKTLVYKYDACNLGYAHSGDVLNLVSKLPGLKVYAWNLTRSKPAQLSEQDLYSAMESVKDGIFINTKYETSRVLMNPPHVLVFANHLPKTQHISTDRWKIMGFDEQQQLVDVDAILQAPQRPPTAQFHPVNGMKVPPPPPLSVPQQKAHDPADYRDATGYHGPKSSKNAVGDEDDEAALAELFNDWNPDEYDMDSQHSFDL